MYNMFNDDSGSDSYRKQIDNLHQLYPFVWVASMHIACNSMQDLKNSNIHQVINVSEDDHEPIHKQAYKKLGIRYKWLKTFELDNVNIVKRGLIVAKDIRKFADKGQSTLVHCYAGRNRSISCILAFKILDSDDPTTIDAALAHIQSIRPIAGPMPSFMRQLRKLEDKANENRLLGDASMFI